MLIVNGRGISDKTVKSVANCVQHSSRLREEGRHDWYLPTLPGQREEGRRGWYLPSYQLVCHAWNEHKENAVCLADLVPSGTLLPVWLHQAGL
jgi:hypothetical protein